jgi:diguanylate cyclase (GGDEF)-like protein
VNGTFARTKAPDLMHDDHQDFPYAAVFAATAPLLVLTPDLVICEAADAYLAAVGRFREELVGRHLFDAFPGSASSDAQHVAEVRASLERARDTGRPDSLVVQRYDIRVGDGTFVERYWNAIHVPVLDEEGRTMLLLQRAEDVTEYVRARRDNRCSCGCGCDPASSQTVEWDVFARAAELQSLNAELRVMQDQLAERALHDSLTGLLIRPVIVEQVSRALARSARRPQLVAVLFVDLDRLKQVNDRHGHAAGDQLLRCFAEQLQANLRPGDAVARYGGDEFVVLLEDLPDAAGVEAVAARLLEVTRECELPPGLPVRPSASVGIALTSDPDVTADTLISRADQAMYCAKRAGGDRYEVFRDDATV